ncbi:hypothetical protein N9153_03610 [Planctomicrobium sp.]|nr:hypothetical protein [Planctomicrobium sp.]
MEIVYLQELRTFQTVSMDHSSRDRHTAQTDYFGYSMSIDNECAASADQAF